jgi:hypothetical protein
VQDEERLSGLLVQKTIRNKKFTKEKKDTRGVVKKKKKRGKEGKEETLMASTSANLISDIFSA